MSDTPSDLEINGAGVVIGLTQIGRAFGHGPGAARRWIATGLPARKLPGKAGPWITTTRLLDLWILEFRKGGQE